MQKMFLFLTLFLTSSFSYAQISVKLQQPPPNQLRATDIWKLTLVNPTKGTIQISLAGTLEEAGTGIIADGTSKPLNLPPGTKYITYDDVKAGNINFKSGKWSDAFTRTGNAPSGDYTICIYVKDKSGDEIGSDCIYQKVEINSPPTLISPVEGEIVQSEIQPPFTWASPMPLPAGQITYKLKIVEVVGNQSPEVAIQSNLAWFEKTDIRTTMFQYPIAARKFQTGKKYAWQITSVEKSLELGKSEVWIFSYKSNELTEKSTEIKQCDVFKVELGKTYLRDTNYYKLLITNNYSGNFAGNIPRSFRITVKGDSVISIVGGILDGWKRTPSKFPPGSSIVKWMISKGDIPKGKTDLGNIVFKGGSGMSAKVVYEWLDNKDSLICKDSTQITHEIKSYHELNLEISNSFIEILDNYLNIEYVNSYSAVDNILLNIYDVEKYEVVKTKSKLSEKSKNSDKEKNHISFNGLNRISLNLKDYELQTGTTYLLIVSNAKSNYYLNFKVSRQDEN